MIESIHPVEQAWRQFRSFGVAPVLVRMLEHAAKDSIRLPGVVLSSDVVASFWNKPDFTRDAAISQTTMHVWAAYRASKTIYQIEPALVECLNRSSWPGNTPLSALRLPSYCVIFDLTRDGQRCQTAVTYDEVPANDPDTLMRSRSAGPSTLYLALHAPIRGLTTMWSRIFGMELAGAETLTEGARLAATFAAKSATTLLKQDGLSDEQKERLLSMTSLSLDSMFDLGGGSKFVSLIFNLLLYLAGNEDIVRVVHPGVRPSCKPSLQRRDPERYMDLRDPKIHSVGSKFQQYVERWEIEHGNDEDVKSGRTMRPHMRRAHSHLYWTGIGREIPRVRFLLPISVHGTRIEEPTAPTLIEMR